VIIFDDADIDAAVEGIRTFGFYNAGQDCTAACRIYAQEGIYEFVEKLGAAVSSIKYGLQDDPSTELGPLITGSTATASPGSSNAPWRSRTSA
jgi:aminobutyraldehyde dehydrogenase